MKLSRWSVAFYVALVFLSGVLLGGYGYRAYNAGTVAAKSKTSPEEYKKRYLNEYRTRLQLSPEQVSKLEMILDETRARFHEARQKIDPEMKSIQSEQIDKVNQMLSPDQRGEYEKMRKEREEKMRKRGGPRMPPGI